MSFPSHPDRFTTGWLERVLGAPAGSLIAFSAKPVGTGQMSLSFRVTLNWKNNEGPASLIAKCPSLDAGTRAIAAALRAYALELGWYRELAPQISVACPACLHLESNDDETDFVLLLQDLAPAQQGDQLAGASIAQIEAALTQAANLHAPYWGDTRLSQIGWLQPSPNTTALIRQMAPAVYTQFRSRYTERFAPEILDLCDAFVARIGAYFDLKPASLTVQHRDFRIDNILFAPDNGQAYVVDWQTLGPGPGAADVAYLIGTSIADANVRAREEERLVSLYADALRARGAAADAEQIWREYRLYAFSGVLMAIIASTNVERTERGDEMFAVMAERPARQALHLESLSLL
ncbi:MAG: aminoglycoside phosphotransferase family protein [Hyphomonadaceae bacterium]|nr:aminoglycoside phosphotransferase family protein [Hyphomonadaceae bacterium]